MKKVSAILAAVLALAACGTKKHSSASTTTSTSTTLVTIPIPTVPVDTTTTVAGTSSTTSTSTAATTTTVAATTTTTASTTGVLRTCATTDLAPLSAATDKTSYTAGQNVVLTMSFTNHSKTLCQIARVAAVSVVSPAGKVVHQQTYSDNFQGATGRIKPGQTFTLTFGWDQTGCTVGSARCPASGGYNLAASLGELSTASTFTVA